MNASAGYWVGFTVAVLLLTSVEIITAAMRPPPPPKQKIERVHLPTECAPFYNTGTDAWIECMGVEYK